MTTPRVVIVILSPNQDHQNGSIDKKSMINYRLNQGCSKNIESLLSLVLMKK